MGIKLLDILNEAGDQWQVKDAIALKKAHERVLLAIGTLEKSAKNLEKVVGKHKGKPNSELLAKEAQLLIKGVEKGVTGTTSYVWDAWDAFRHSCKAIFGKHWN
jgi:hypothetical protein